MTQLLEADPLAGLGLNVDPEFWKKERYMAEFALTGQERSAAYHSGVKVSTLLRWKREDPEFVERMEQAQQMLVERLVTEAIHRATVGDCRLKFHKGELIMIQDQESGKYEPYVEYQKSDRLLITLLQAFDPRFKPAASSTEINISNSNSLELGVVENPAFYGNAAHDLIETEVLDGRNQQSID